MRVIVAGAGPAGVAATRSLATGGHDPVLIEASERIGGLATSFELAGVTVDLGSHRLHPACDARVMADLDRLLGDDLLRRPRHGRIRMADRWISYPLRPGEMLGSFPRRTAGAFARDLLRTSVRRRSATAESFADVLVQRFGTTLCEQFYFPYARKLWGVEPEELDTEQARRRVSAPSLVAVARKVVRSALGGPAHFSYPRGGFGRICEVLCSEAEEAGADVRVGARVLKVADHTDGVSVGTTRGDIEADLLLSTVPLGALRSLVDGGEGGRPLPSRGMVLVFLAFDIDRFSEWDAHYVPDDAFALSRVSEPKWYAGGGVPLGRTALCVEIPTDPGTSLWQSGDDQVAALALAELAGLDLPIPGEPVDTGVRRLTDVYPVYTRESLAERRRLLDWSTGLSRVRTLGRQGLFVHDNSHHALEMGYTAADCVSEGGFEDAAWAAALRRWEANVVED